MRTLEAYLFCRQLKFQLNELEHLLADIHTCMDMNTREYDD